MARVTRWLTGRLADLLAAFLLLTRLPLAQFARPGTPADLARCVWAFPVVGLVTGVLGWIVWWLAHRLGFPPVLAAAWTLAAATIVTGALHEDGLADTADGFGGGATRARKLEIMRDSRIGGYGTLALILSVTVRVAAIAALDDPPRVLMALCLAGMLGRSGILVLLLALRPARDDGLGAAMRDTPTGSAAVGLLLAVGLSLLFQPIQIGLAAVLCALGATLAMAKLSQRQIGGHTGDVLGAGEIAVECVVLTLAAAELATGFGI